MGKVYILTNDAMPGIVKIGVTDQTLKDRMKWLDNTSVPLPFRFYFAIEIPRHHEIEMLAHNAFTAFRVRENREFFRIDPEQAVAALRISGCEEILMRDEMIDSEGNAIIDDNPKKNKAKRFSFSMLRIPVGAELCFTRDENKKCTVVSDKKVEYQGSFYSISALAKLMLKEVGYDWSTVNGSAFFEYNGETLKDIRNKMDENAEEEEEEEEE